MITVAEIVTNLNSYIGDATTDRVSAAERLQYITEATVWLQESLENDTQNVTYAFNYFDGVHYYKVTSALADLLEGADLRRQEADQFETMAHKSSRELAEEIGQMAEESSWCIEYKDGQKYLVVNHQSKYEAFVLADMNTISAGGGTWVVDATNSDATNLTVDSNEFKVGGASLNFDITVSQSGNNRATIYNSSLSVQDLSSYENLGSWIMWVYLPIVTYFSSVTLYWGTDSSSYWSATVTSNMNGDAFVVGWNQISVQWSAATKTGTPVSTAVGYFRIDLNYTGSQANNTDYRVDNLNLVRPEVLDFHYISWNIGTDTTGVTHRTAFSATTDIPYFSGQYDQYKYAVAHKAAALVFHAFRLNGEHDAELGEATRSLIRAKGIIPSSKNPEVKSFKVRGVNLSRHRRR